MSHNKELKARLIDEARSASALDHPKILFIYDVAETSCGELFIAMAYHQGVTLHAELGCQVRYSQSNVSSASGAAGKFQGLGPFGTYDMAATVAEWCRNESGSGGARYQLDGGFNTSPSEYFEPQWLPPFHRAANAGFRCVRNTAPLPAEAAAERRLTIRDF